MAWTMVRSTKAERETVVALSEEALNDSSKDLRFTEDVGFGSELEVLSLRIEFTATATVGSRVLRVQVADAADDILRELQLVGGTITAGVSKVFEIAPGLPVTDGSVIEYEVLPSQFVIGHGLKLRVLDTAAVDAAADDMVLHVTGRVR